jgi:copper(I)-binding protein
VQPQCGCTTAGDWTKQVEPGKTGVIPIQFNTANYNGPVFKQVTVTCNVTNQTTLFVQLKGTVYKAYDLIPPMGVLTIPPDAETASAIVTITNNTEEPLVLSAPESNNRAFAAELKTTAPGKGYQLIVSAVPPMPAGTVQAQISLHTSWTNPAVINVPFAANVQPAVMVIPSYITLAAGALDKAVTNSVAIQNNSTNALQLSDPAVNVPGVNAQIKETQSGKSFAVLVAFPQGFQIPPGQQVELSVKSSNPKYPLLKVPIMQMPRSTPPPAQLLKPTPPPAGTPPMPPMPGGH